MDAKVSNLIELSPEFDDGDSFMVDPFEFVLVVKCPQAVTTNQAIQVTLSIVPYQIEDIFMNFTLFCLLCLHIILFIILVKHYTISLHRSRTLILKYEFYVNKN